MRKQSFERLLAGTMLAAIVAAPTMSMAEPDRVQSAGPMPPSLNGQMPRRHEAAPVPPPSATPVARRATPEPRAQDARAQAEPVVQAIPAAPAARSASIAAPS